MSKSLIAVLCAVVVAAVATPLAAQTYPDRPIKVIVAYPPGGPTDTIARVATQGLDQQLHQAVIIENVAGAGGRIGTRDVARAMSHAPRPTVTRCSLAAATTTPSRR